MKARRNLSRSARRASAGRESRCPVLTLAREYEQLAAKHLSLDAPATGNEESLALINFRLASIADEASYRVARSITGALFQIMLLRDQQICSTLEADEATKECELQRIDRLAYALKEYFLNAGADALPTVTSYCMSASHDPHRRLATLRA